MEVLVISQSEVHRLLPMDECMEVMTEALQALARSEAVMPLRQVLSLPGREDALAAMPGYIEPPQALGLKVITIFPGNTGTRYDSHQGAVLLFEAQHGRLLAIIDAGEITAIRTAAVSGVATRLLAREDAGDLAILGTGVQAHTHLEAMLWVRRIRRVRVWGRTPRHAKVFAHRQSQRHGIKVEAVEAAEAAVQGADLICTVTAATDPVLLGKWISPGTHINAVGAHSATTRELDTAAAVKSKLFVDRRESAIKEAGVFLLAKQEGAIGDDHIKGEIGDLLLGRVGGRESPEEITLFKSLGLAVEDLAAAHHIYQEALGKGMGTFVELGGSRYGDS